MSTSRASEVLPIPVRYALRKLGHDIRDARRRRRIPVALAAQRSSISRTTLVKIEKGDRGVAIGNYATVLFVMGMVERLADVADPKNDAMGLQLEEEHLPKRIRGARKPKRRGPSRSLRLPPVARPSRRSGPTSGSARAAGSSRSARRSFSGWGTPKRS